MITNILEYAERTAERLPEKTAFAGEKETLSFQELLSLAQSAGTFLAERGASHKPVVVFMEKRPSCVAAMLGAVYAGSFYLVMDEDMPAYRISLILDTLKAEFMICDETTRGKAESFGFSGTVFDFNEMTQRQKNDAVLKEIRDTQLDNDPVYIVFTSGSTGVPKGVLACHRSVIDYAEQFAAYTGFDETCIFGGQAPLYVDASLKELLITFMTGATTVLIPQQLFLFPVRLIEFLNTHEINTLCWTASALSLVSSMKTFDTILPAHVRAVTFVGEVFPVKQMNAWRAALPNARFYNVYGPTEITGVCCAYEVTRDFAPEESVPVGKPFRNTGILLLNDDGTETAPGEVGEICVKGTCLALGYYNNPEKTAEVFVQNPLNPFYPERIYKTGDLGRYDEEGNLYYVSRKDFQIKHMGHRIELGEIEAVASAMDGVETVCCLFDDDKKKIVFYYTGAASKGEAAKYLKEKLPRYMAPSFYEQLERMPYTANGKIDRMKLKERYESCKN